MRFLRSAEQARETKSMAAVRFCRQCTELLASVSTTRPNDVRSSCYTHTHCAIDQRQWNVQKSGVVAPLIAFSPALYPSLLLPSLLSPFFPSPCPVDLTIGSARGIREHCKLHGGRKYHHKSYTPEDQIFWAIFLLQTVQVQLQPL